jgi:glyoxylase-like metal-dependent hydrolase (beta-lactamase superfamily II)
VSDDPQADWTAAGIFEVVPGVYRIPLPLPNDGLRAVNAYAIVGAGAVDVVDPGWDIPESRERLRDGLASIDLSMRDIRNFLVTHVHRDHYTQAVAVRRELGTKVSLGIGERPSLEALGSPARRALAWQLDALKKCGAVALALDLELRREQMPPLDARNWAFPDEWLVPGQVALPSGRSLTVIETPGHTRGHVVFHDPDARALFAGDHVLPRITPSIGFEQVPLANPLSAFLGSLALVRSLPDAMLLPAHGPVAPSVHARVDELVEHHGRRLDLIDAALSSGPDTAWAIAGQLLWTRRERQLDELDQFNQMLAVLETNAHLVLLVSQGRAGSSVGADGIEHYRPVA